MIKYYNSNCTSCVIALIEFSSTSNLNNFESSHDVNDDDEHRDLTFSVRLSSITSNTNRFSANTAVIRNSVIHPDDDNNLIS